MKRTVMALLLIATACAAAAQDRLCGHWYTIDDKRGERASEVELYGKGGRYYVRVTDLFGLPEGMRPEDLRCEACRDGLKGKPVLGMHVVDGARWENGALHGKILDPENGKIYTVRIWLDAEDSDRLHVRGYLGPFYRTQTWERKRP